MCRRALWLLVALSVATPSFAQDTATRSEPSSGIANSREEPEALLARAVAAYERGELSEALSLFERVHALAPTARTLRSLAMVAYRQERFAEAAALFDQSLASNVKPLAGRMREDAVQLLEEASVRANARARQQPASAVGEPPLQVEAQQVRPAEPPAKLVPNLQLPERRQRSLRLKRSGYALLALSAATLIGGGAAWLVGMKRLDGIADHCREQPDGQCLASDARRRETAARLDLLSALSIAGLVVGAAAGAGSVVLLTLHYHPPSASNEHATLFVGATVRGRF